MEVYGTKPKRFTKDWWPYFWDYYKLHTIGIILAAIAVISFISDCRGQKNYDLQIDVITENQISEEALNKLSDIVYENIDDVTQNGKTEAYINYLDMSENGDPQYMEAMHTKMMIESGYTDAFVFLVSKKYADYMSELGVFKPASEWTDSESYDGYTVNLQNCEILENCGIDTSDLYLGIVNFRERDKKSQIEKNRPKQENGIKFAKLLLNEE